MRLVWIGLLALKTYVVIVLVVTAVLSPPVLSFVPALVILWYLYVWFWPTRPSTSLFTELFVFFAIALLLSPSAGLVAAALAPLPVLLLVHRALEDNAGSVDYRETTKVRQPTQVSVALMVLLPAVLVVSMMFGNLPLLVASATTIGYFVVLGTVAVRCMSVKPVSSREVRCRVLAGKPDSVTIELSRKTRIAGRLHLESPYEWVKVRPDVEESTPVRVSFSPPLSGPAEVRLVAYAIDRWGLLQVKFQLEPIVLNVIPRARYAAWLARAYLGGSKAGTLPPVTDMKSVAPTYGLRRGIEYYGSQLYQPGDSLKNIDWKHSLRHDQLVTKEFTEVHGQAAIVLVNLTAGSAEEADKLAYNLIATAISLAREGIPAVVAAYDHETVKTATGRIEPRQLVVESLKLVGKITIREAPVRFLRPPDVNRLRADLSRVRQLTSPGALRLGELFQFEYRSLSQDSKRNPSTRALLEAMARSDSQSTVVFVSCRNHDAEAIAFHSFDLSRKGMSVLSVV